VDSTWIIWLDADDEFLPGRVARLIALAEEFNADLVFDGAELWDGLTRQKLRDLAIPEFLSRPDGHYLQLLRNWLPGSAWPLIKTEVAKKVGYDATLYAAEDLDFNLRAILMGFRVALDDRLGYRQYAYKNSLSRDIDHQNESVRLVLSKLVMENVESRVRGLGFSNVAKHILIANVYLRRNEFESASKHLEEALTLSNQPDGPVASSNYLEEWFPYSLGDVLFQLASINLLTGKTSLAEKLFRELLGASSTPELLNNIGVLKRLSGDEPSTEKYFKEALRQNPDYFDAACNISRKTSSRITLYPLRRYANRFEYN
jgi:tetratricopeptide (TPR) repeat protein